MQNRIREVRKRLNMTQEEFAETLQCTQVSLSAWERGTREPKCETLCQIADMGGCSLDWLLCRTNDITFEASKESIDDTIQIADNAREDAPNPPYGIDDDTFDEYMRAHMDEAVRRYFKTVIFRPEEPQNK